MLINPNLKTYKFLKKNNVFTVLDLFYQILFIIGGMDHGFFRYKIVPVKLVKLYSFVLCVALNIAIFRHFYFIESLFRYSWTFAVVIKYDLYILHLIFLRKNNSFYNLFQDLFGIDSKCGIDASSYVEIKVLFSSFGWMCVKIVVSAIYCYFTKGCSPLHRLFITFIMAVSSDIFIVIYVFMFYAIYSRMKQLRLLLNKTESDFATQQCMYGLYVDTIEKYKKAFDPTIIISLCCNIPDIMLTGYNTLVEWRYGTMKMDAIELSFQYIFISLSLVITLAPAISAEMLSSQTKLITLILHDKLMQEQDERAVFEIHRFINYVNARSCQFHVYKLIPLNISLIGMVISFCVTYLIVIIQFTKLY